MEVGGEHYTPDALVLGKCISHNNQTGEIGEHEATIAANQTLILWSSSQ
jgi:hypothetical protein